MAPVGTAGYVMVAALAVQAVLFGAFGGAIAWAIRAGLLWGGLLTAASFLAAAVPLGFYRLEPAVLYGMPLMTLTFLTAWLSARSLETRAAWRRVWAALAGLAAAVVVGFLWLLPSRLDLWAPVWLALGADVGLVYSA